MPTNGLIASVHALPEAGVVRLTLRDQLGRTVATLVDAVQSAGAQQAEFDATRLPTGVYSYQLVAGSRQQTLRVVVAR